MTYVEEPGLEDLDDEFAEDSELSDDLEQYAPAPWTPVTSSLSTGWSTRCGTLR